MSRSVLWRCEHAVAKRACRLCGVLVAKRDRCLRIDESRPTWHHNSGLETNACVNRDGTPSALASNELRPISKINNCVLEGRRTTREMHVAFSGLTQHNTVQSGIVDTRTLYACLWSRGNISSSVLRWRRRPSTSVPILRGCLDPAQGIATHFGREFSSFCTATQSRDNQVTERQRWL